MTVLVCDLAKGINLPSVSNWQWRLRLLPVLEGDLNKTWRCCSDRGSVSWLEVIACIKRVLCVSQHWGLGGRNVDLPCSWGDWKYGSILYTEMRLPKVPKWRKGVVEVFLNSHETKEIQGIWWEATDRRGNLAEQAGTRSYRSCLEWQLERAIYYPLSYEQSWSD